MPVFMWLLADEALNNMWRRNLIHLSFGLRRCNWPSRPEETLIKLYAAQSWLLALRLCCCFCVTHELRWAKNWESWRRRWWRIKSFENGYFLSCVFWRCEFRFWEHLKWRGIVHLLFGYRWVFLSAEDT